MPVTLQTKNLHLLWRAGFGPSAQMLLQLSNTTPNDLYNTLAKNSKANPEYWDVADNALKGLFMGLGDAVKMETIRKNGLDNETKKKIREQSRKDIAQLNMLWVNEMINGKAQLREKMALFWHNHFACRDVNIFFQQKYLQTLRNNALGKFGDLLLEVSQTASMLSFLNNQQNRKQHPNENFAREVMELFTLGRGQYTEEDIKEAARAFTGWGFNLQGEFVFRRQQHDAGIKTFMGKTGRFTGEDIINILLENKQTAYYLCTKIYKHFVNENKPNEVRIQELTNRFYQTGYDIADLMKTIFTAAWFYDAANIGTRIKSPIELWTGIRRLLPMQLENQQIQILFQRVLGQVLFYPPNVAGWAGGKNWIDSSTLMLRMRLPQLLNDDDEITIAAKSDDDVMMGRSDDPSKKVNNSMLKKGGFKINANIDWAAFIDPFSQVPRQHLLDVLEALVLQTPPGSIQEKVLESSIDASSREQYIKTATIALMSTPEYQLC
jgi:hypothetical protein